ncbi:MAG: AAA family ATPase [Sandaracinaceae bacterium]
MEISYNNFARGGTKPKITGNCLRPVFTQLTSEAAFGPKHTESRKQIPAAARRVAATLAGVLALDPAPRRMRGYAHRLDDDLRSDGANISAVLSSLDARRHARALEFVRALPEQDIKAIDFVATPRDEVMVKLEESFGGTTSWHDASVLSDGTLRVLAIAAALLSVREGSVVVIEEVDNGIHPPG